MIIIKDLVSSTKYQADEVICCTMNFQENTINLQSSLLFTVRILNLIIEKGSLVEGKEHVYPVRVGTEQSLPYFPKLQITRYQTALCLNLDSNRFCRVYCFSNWVLILILLYLRGGKFF